MATDDPKREKHPDKQRREFLRKSVYAAYATPLITSLLVAENSVAASRCSLEWCAQRNFHPKCCR